MTDTTQDELAPTGEPDWKANAMSLSAAMDRQAEYHELEKRQLLQRLDAARALLAKGAPEPKDDPARSAAYDAVDNYLRNTLADSEYADYLKCLDLIYAAPAVPGGVDACPTCRGSGRSIDAVEYHGRCGCGRKFRWFHPHSGGSPVEVPAKMRTYPLDSIEQRMFVDGWNHCVDAYLKEQSR